MSPDIHLIAGRGQERVDDLPGRRVCGRRRRAQADPSAGPAGQHLGGRSAPAEDRGDRGERDLEHMVTDEIWAEAARHYDERQLGALVLMVAITNFFNGLNTTFRVPAGTRWD